MTKLEELEHQVKTITIAMERILTVVEKSTEVLMKQETRIQELERFQRAIRNKE